ncbi:NADH:flavin oxidoreductase/NADH oxidase [Aquabacterium sp. A7-Y]|uniref:NADH:flavin oxidoreductase/NADH oxidase n=1 Tax=Aquabacterium sp. A7-Y TaxID=1349605 RepID=UPI00223DF15A|nr:NADH:flavin oxidoreductase/NADH oxidase [Aquabacterium sp. A7-Y]MCW7538523.1 NADH:flavin oxidoreductase/NADH oxidase [Aquabacterium sp. A7-Y]
MSLFSPLQLGNVTLRNRIAISPMCLYSAQDGLPGDWHLVHLGSRAIGGAGLVIAEATAVCPEGRITHGCTGLWNEAQQAAWGRIAAFVRAQGAEPALQLAHAGRKASTDLPWRGGRPLSVEAGGWTPSAPSALAYDSGYNLPRALDEAGIEQVISDFAAAAGRAAAAGFSVLEIHAAHGYLFHEFLSPLSNCRDDRYGGSLENRARLLRSVVAAVRQQWPLPRPLLVRLSATDWAPGGWDIDECVTLARWLKEDSVDLIDTSSGLNIAHAKVPVGPEYQVPFAARIRREAGVATGAVGLITSGRQADDILRRGDADLVLLARESLRDPYFPRRAAAELDIKIPVPEQYLRAW